VAPGDVAVALDGIALTAANCDRRLENYRDGDVLELVFFRGDELMMTEVRLAAAPATTVYLQVDDAADASAASRRNAWLQPD
jgi:predicted metalloprotease with PDZ domain